MGRQEAEVGDNSQLITRRLHSVGSRHDCKFSIPLGSQMEITHAWQKLIQMKTLVTHTSDIIAQTSAQQNDLIRDNGHFNLILQVNVEHFKRIILICVTAQLFLISQNLPLFSKSEVPLNSNYTSIFTKIVLILRVPVQYMLHFSTFVSIIYAWPPIFLLSDTENDF